MSRPQRTVLFADGLWVEKFGPMSLIPLLEKAGFTVHLLLTRNPKTLLAEVARLRPEYLAFSVTTGYHAKALALASLVKARFPEVKVVFGGPHVTYYPGVAAHPAVDLAFRGECDELLPEALRMLEEGAAPETVPNLVVGGGPSNFGGGPSNFGGGPSNFGGGRRDGTAGGLRFGPVAELVEELDSLPFPDRKHFYRYRFFRNSPYKSFIVSRGCPHRCTFCFNQKLKEIYRGKGRFVRLRSPEAIVEEALLVRARYGLKLASFEDDLLTFDRKWLGRLLTLWKERVNVPYNLNAMASDLTDETLVKLLKETGAWCVAFGVETGSEALRKQLLNKPVSDQQLLEAAARLNKHRVKFLTYNMFALPGETLDDALATLRLNRRMGTTLARHTLFQPYPGTELGDQVAAGMPEEEMLYHSSPLTGSDIRRIERLQKFALLGMRSELGEKLGLWASALPLSPLHTAVFWTTYFDVVRKYMKTGTWHLAEVGVRSLTDWV